MRARFPRRGETDARAVYRLTRIKIRERATSKRLMSIRVKDNSPSLRQTMGGGSEESGGEVKRE